MLNDILYSDITAFCRDNGMSLARKMFPMREIYKASLYKYMLSDTNMLRCGNHNDQDDRDLWSALIELGFTMDFESDDSNAVFTVIHSDKRYYLHREDGRFYKMTKGW